MSERLDLSKIDVEDFLVRLGIQNVRQKGDEVFFSCPFEGHASGDMNPSTSMQQGSTMFKCFGCGQKGNAIHFLAEFEKISPIEAKKWIRKEFFGGYNVPDGPFVEHIRSIIQTTDEPFSRDRVLPSRDFFRKTLVDWTAVAKEQLLPSNAWSAAFRYMLDRGFTPEILDAHGIGYDDISERITIPVTFNGKIVGFKARTPFLNEKPRYKVLGGFPYEFDTYDTSSYLYGLEYAASYGLGYAASHQSVHVLCEGELNALAMWQMGWHGAFGLSGKHLSEKQARTICKYFDRVVILMDEVKDAREAARIIDNRIPTKIVLKHAASGAERNWDPADLLTIPYGDDALSYFLAEAVPSQLVRV